MKYSIRYHPDVKKIDFPKIDAKIKAAIKRAIENRLSENPEAYGKPLQKSLKGYWKLRVGDFRIVFKPMENELVILGIIHRKDVYGVVSNR